MPRPDDAAIATLPVRLFLRELEACGVDGAGLLAAVGLSKVGLEDPRATVAWSKCLKLMDRLEALQLGDDLGVRAGTRTQLADLDLAGLYLRTQDSAKDAAAFHRDYRDVFEPSRLTDVYPADQSIVVAFSPPPGTRANPLLFDCLLAAALAWAKFVLGPFEPVAVHLRRARPATDASHLRVFGSALHFDADLDALLLPRDPQVIVQLPYRDEAVRCVLEPHVKRHIDDIRAARSDLSARARLAIREELRRHTLSMDTLSRRLQMSPRSLRRSLQGFGTSYSELVHEVRAELARGYALEFPQRRGPEIAALLGFSDAHVFYRAFKRWTGTSLSQFRQQWLAASEGRDSV